MKACRLTCLLQNEETAPQEVIHEYNKAQIYKEIKEQIYNIYFAVKRESFSCVKYIYIYHLYKVWLGILLAH